MAIKSIRRPTLAVALPVIFSLLVLAPVVAHALPAATAAEKSTAATSTFTSETNSDNSIPQHVLVKRSNKFDPKGCGFDGDEDMYGLGIRIGYYIQWIATVFGAYFTPKIVSSAFEANAIFNIGMLAGLVYTTIARTEMYVVEPVMVLGFSVGGAIVGVLDPKNVHDPKNLKSLRARLVHLAGTGALSLPLLTYWVWYSFHGMDTLKYNPCSTYTFFIVKINIWDKWFRIFMKVATILAIVGLFSLGIGVVVAYRIKVHELPENRGDGLTIAPRLTERPRLSRTTTALALRARPTKLQFIIVIACLAVCALSVELSIIWNKISGVNTLAGTGQLIPMAIGVVTSFRVVLGVLNDRFKGRRQRRKEERIFSGPGETIRIGRGGGLMAYAGDDNDVTPKDEDGDADDSPGTQGSTTKASGSGVGRAKSIRSVRLSDNMTTLSEKKTAARQSVISIQQQEFSGSRPRISPSNTSDSNSTIVSTSRYASSTKSGRESLGPLPPPPATLAASAASAALGAGPSAGSIITQGGRKKLQRRFA